jgi:hypothetical protein
LDVWTPPFPLNFSVKTADRLLVSSSIIFDTQLG